MRPYKGGCQGIWKNKNKFIFNTGKENHNKIPLIIIISKISKIIIMIMVKISTWGSPNVQYLDMGVAGQKGWEPLVNIHYKLMESLFVGPVDILCSL